MAEPEIKVNGVVVGHGHDGMLAALKVMLSEDIAQALARPILEDDEKRA